MSTPGDDTPPRRDTVEPVPLTATPPLVAPPSLEPAANRDAQLKKWSIVGFCVLALLAVGVFFLLPTAVEQRREREPDLANEPARVEDPQPAAAPRPVLDEQDPIALAARSAAEESLADFVSLELSLSEQDVEAWAADPFAEARARAREAERMLRERDFVAAATRMNDAVAQLQSLEERGRALFEEALRAGELALGAGDAAAAHEQFERAARMRPDDQRASIGLQRAERVEEAFALLREGNESEEAGDLVTARERYAAGIELDGELEALQVALRRVDDQQTRDAFQSAMSTGFAALGRGDPPRAIASFRKALQLRPNAPSALDGLAQAQEAGRDRGVAEQRARAENFEAQEQWHEAARAYAAALALDPAVSFAQVGLTRSRNRARLSDALEHYRQQPARLSESKVRDEAAQTLAQAREVADPGPVLREQIDTVSRSLEAMSTPVAVELLSDAQTDVLLYHVGRLGRFEVRRVELTPGDYTIVGTRAGYRDVRERFTIRSGVAPPSVMIRCEEKI